MRPFLLPIVSLSMVLLLARPAAAEAPFKTDRPHKAVVIGGSISMFYSGNFGQFLEFGCKNLEVVNKGRVGAGGPKLHQILQDEVLRNQALMGQITRGKGWILFQGGLNSVGSPEMTAYFLSRLFQAAHDGGLRVFALTLTPWGTEKEKRFQGFEGLYMHRATEHISDFILGRLDPKTALGRRAAGHPGKWQPGELPEIAVDVWRSPLRAGNTEDLRPAAALEQEFARSRYRKQASDKRKLIAEARAVPQRFLHAKYKSFDHIHPNVDGHRVMAALACQKAPAEWGCDCDAIRHAQWKGKVVAGP